MKLHHYRSMPSLKRNGGQSFLRFLLVLALIFGGLLGVATLYLDESPQQVWTRLTTLLGKSAPDIQVPSSSQIRSAVSRLAPKAAPTPVAAPKADPAAILANQDSAKPAASAALEILNTQSKDNGGYFGRPDPEDQEAGRPK